MHTKFGLDSNLTKFIIWENIRKIVFNIRCSSIAQEEGLCEGGKFHLWFWAIYNCWLQSLGYRFCSSPCFLIFQHLWYSWRHVHFRSDANVSELCLSHINVGLESFSNWNIQLNFPGSISAGVINKGHIFSLSVNWGQVVFTLDSFRYCWICLWNCHK